MITDKMLADTYVEANALGCEHITMIAYADLGNGYELIYGVVENPDQAADDAWTPFTRRPRHHSGMKLWQDFSAGDPGLAIAETLKVIDSIMTGAVKDPHAEDRYLTKQEELMFDALSRIKRECASFLDRSGDPLSDNQLKAFATRLRDIAQVGRSAITGENSA